MAELPGAKVEDGGPAFPSCGGFKENVYIEYDVEKRTFTPLESSEGMMLRDYFAAQALALWRIDDADLRDLKDGQLPRHEVVAKFCYELADAMIRARTIGNKAT